MQEGRLDGALPGAARFEDYNAQISLLTGMAAAAIMLARASACCARCRRQRRRDLSGCGARRPRWGRVAGRRSRTPSSSAASTRPPSPRRSCGGRRPRPRRAYTPFDGAPPAESMHWAVAAPYAHATAPLRRLQDRYVLRVLPRGVGNRPEGWRARRAAGRDGRRRRAGECGRARRRRPRRGGGARRPRGRDVRRGRDRRRTRAAQRPGGARAVEVRARSGVARSPCGSSGPTRHPYGDIRARDAPRDDDRRRATRARRRPTSPPTA